MGVANSEQVPVNVVGSSVFGRFPKISIERTFNMFTSDNWSINYAGFKKIIEFLPLGEGRGFFRSVRGKFLIAVVSSSVYRLNNFIPELVGEIETTTGEVFIAENLSSQICIVDQESAYIYNAETTSFTKQTLTFDGNTIIPSYVSYHNTFFLFGSSALSINSQNWYAYEYNNADTIKFNSQMSLQSKPDSALVVKPMPGRGNNVIVIGETVSEIWTQVGGIENYRKVQSFNIDSGTSSISTIAGSDEFVCWLSQNENNAPCIMVTDGGSIKRISTDGIDYILSTIKFPNQSTAFFYRQDGHLFYQFTFFNPADNLSFIYDFTVDKFYDITDENLNYHPARDVIYFNQDTYFISLNDAGIYRMNNSLETYDYSTSPTSIGEEIPRIRICKGVRREDGSLFRVGSFTFWLEQGVNTFYLDETQALPNGLMVTEAGDGFILTEDGGYVLTEDSLPEPYPLNANRPRIDMSFSKNGNQSFSNIVSRDLNVNGKYQNQIRWHRMGQANEFTVQLRYWGFNRFVAFNGNAEIY